MCPLEINIWKYVRTFFYLNDETVGEKSHNSQFWIFKKDYESLEM